MCKGMESCEREMAFLLNIVHNAPTTPNIPILGYFWPDWFGNACYKWVSHVSEECNAPATTFGKDVKLKVVRLDYPARGGPETWIILVKVHGEIMGLDYGYLGGDDHICVPQDVLNDETVPLDTREDLRSALKDFGRP
jgi:hypothetical protein